MTLLVNGIHLFLQTMSQRQGRERPLEPFGGGPTPGVSCGAWAAFPHRHQGQWFQDTLGRGKWGFQPWWEAAAFPREQAGEPGNMSIWENQMQEPKPLFCSNCKCLLVRYKELCTNEQGALCPWGTQEP